MHVTSDTAWFLLTLGWVYPGPVQSAGSPGWQVQMVHLADRLPAQLNVTAKPLVWKMGKGLVVVFQSSPKMRPGILGLE